MTGSMINNKKGAVCKKSVRTPENIHHVEQVLRQKPRKSCSAIQLESIINIQDNSRGCENWCIFLENPILFRYISCFKTSNFN
jgi:hypothetical protein